MLRVSLYLQEAYKCATLFPCIVDGWFDVHILFPLSWLLHSSLFSCIVKSVYVWSFNLYFCLFSDYLYFPFLFVQDGVASQFSLSHS